MTDLTKKAGTVSSVYAEWIAEKNGKGSSKYEQIAKVRHLPLLKGEIDYERVQDLFFKDLSDGVFGGITWEKANV